MFPIFFALIFSILLILVFVIPGLFLSIRWTSILGSPGSTNTGGMKVPTFYSTREDINGVVYNFVMSVGGVVFGGIHCVGWFFNFPSSDEAMLRRLSSATLTGIAFLLPVLCHLFLVLPRSFNKQLWIARYCYFCFSTHCICNVTSYIVSGGFHLP